MMHFDIITDIFIEIDDFCQVFEKEWQKSLLDSGKGKRNRPIKMYLSEILTIIVSFQRLGFRCFKHYYLWLKESGKELFPNLLSYSRFVQIMPRVLVPICMFLSSRCKGRNTGISFIDSTKIDVCNNKRIKRNKTFQGVAAVGKSSMGWFYGFKLHLIINEIGELLAFTISPGNIDDRVPVEKMTREIKGKLFGDKGYISSKLVSKLFKKGLQLITNTRKNMKNKLLPLEDKILLRKRSIIETVNDQLKNIAQIQHTRHRSITGFMLNIVAALISYSMMPKKPSLKFRNNQTHDYTRDFADSLSLISS